MTVGNSKTLTFKFYLCNMSNCRVKKVNSTLSEFKSLKVIQFHGEPAGLTILSFENVPLSCESENKKIKTLIITDKRYEEHESFLAIVFC